MLEFLGMTRSGYIDFNGLCGGMQLRCSSIVCLYFVLPCSVLST